MNQVYFYDGPVRFTASVNKICDEIDQRIQRNEGVAPKGTPRILISGCPMAVPNWKLPTIVEKTGAVIVGEEPCVGDRGTQQLTADTGATVDELLDAIVNRYLKIDCAIFTPNEARVEHVLSMAKALRAAGTGQFLEIMATALAYTREEFAKGARQAARAQKLSSMCSVFARSEVISLIARGASKEEMALGIHQSIADRISALAGGVPMEAPVAFTGGCAHNSCLAGLISEALKRPLQVPESPQTAAALGCALLGKGCDGPP